MEGRLKIEKLKYHNSDSVNMKEETSMSPKILMYVCAFLLVLGVAFYFGWSAAYSAWTDIGVYAVSVMLIGFGAFGTWTYYNMDKEKKASSK
ncbi:MAG: hypothetical protein QXT63_02925 [Thermoplasmata archaeon]